MDPAGCVPLSGVKPGTLTPMARGTAASNASGSAADTLHRSRTVCPVLVPPWNDSPWLARIATLRSTPLQYWY